MTHLKLTEDIILENKVSGLIFFAQYYFYYSSLLSYLHDFFINVFHSKLLPNALQNDFCYMTSSQNGRST